MRHILFFVIVLAALEGRAAETEATSAEPVTQEQKQTHRVVDKKLKVLKKKLVDKASPEEIGKAKAEVQKERVKAHAADAKASASPAGQ